MFGVLRGRFRPLARAAHACAMQHVCRSAGHAAQYDRIDSILCRCTLQLDHLLRYVAGGEVGLYFREVDQASPEVQRKMLAAWDLAFNVSDFLSVQLTPPNTWLHAFHAFAAQTDADSLLPDGTVKEARFYTLLPQFFQTQVCRARFVCCEPLVAESRCRLCCAHVFALCCAHCCRCMFVHTPP